MLRLITLLDETGGVELVLPVTPAGYEWPHEAAIETVTVDQLGDLNFFGGKKMGSTTLRDCILPIPSSRREPGPTRGPIWSSWSGGWTGGPCCAGWCRARRSTRRCCWRA